MRKYERHGHAAFGKDGKRKPEYMIWLGMIQRCTNPHRKEYKNYGGRGIQVCECWRNSFMAFLADMGERPSGTSIDRIDSDGDYEPDNCRWATRWEQRHNRRIVSKIGWRWVAGISDSWFCRVAVPENQWILRASPFQSPRMAAFAANELARIAYGDNCRLFNQVFA